MSNRYRLLLLLGIVVALVIVGRNARHIFLPEINIASENIVVTDRYTLTRTVEQDFVVLADQVTLGAESHIEGNAAVVGGEVYLNGRVDGTLVTLGEFVTLSPNFVVDGKAAIIGSRIVLDGDFGGDLTLVGEYVTINEGANLNGVVTSCTDSLTDNRVGDFAAVRHCSEGDHTLTALDFLPFYENGISLPAPDVQITGLATFMLVLSALFSLMLSALAVLAVALFPRHISHIEEALHAVPINLSGLGFLTLVLAFGVVVVLVILLATVPPIGLLLLPIVLLGALVLLGMGIIGWVTVALLVGDWVLYRLVQQQQPPIVAVAVGSLALFVGWHMIALIPFGVLVNLLAMVALGSMGLGAVVLTRIGTRPFKHTHFVQG